MGVGLEALQGGRLLRDFRAPSCGASSACRMRKTIDDALSSFGIVAGSLDPLEGEGRAGAVAQESFEPSTVVGRDVDRGIDAERTGGLPAEHVIGDVTFEQTVACRGKGE